jgi:predicted metallo-beta-lactamase superfamily hydrolase
MRPVPVGGGEISVVPLAFESLGVRGMSLYVRTEDLGMVVDPGSSLGPRFGLTPHRREYRALSSSRELIQREAGRAEVLTVSHFHYDHYLPPFENWLWLWSSPSLAERLYRGKTLLMKDFSSGVTPSQRKRGYLLRKFCSGLAREVRVADGRKFRFGGTELEFSEPVPHGREGSRMGSVLMLSVRAGRGCLVHAPDVQGLLSPSSLSFILRREPQAVVVGGPPLYLRGFGVKGEELEEARENLRRLARRVPLLVVDHHLLRSLDYREYLSPVREEARRRGNRVCTAAELVGREPEPLEARRRELYGLEPERSSSS